MGADIKVWLDQHDGIIMQRVEGTLGEHDGERLYAMTDEVARQLPPGAPVLVLLDAREIKLPLLAARKQAAAALKRAPITRLALWGCPPAVRVTIRFLTVATGQKNIRVFRGEHEARKWLSEATQSAHT